MNLVGLSNSVTHRHLLSPVQLLRRCLLDRPDADEAHGGRAEASATASASLTSVLVRLHVGRHKLRAHQRYAVIISSGQSVPVMRTAAGLHRERSPWTGTPDTIANRPGVAACVPAPLHWRRPPSHEIPSIARSIPARVALSIVVRSVVDSNGPVIPAFEAARMKRGRTIPLRQGSSRQPSRVTTRTAMRFRDANDRPCRRPIFRRWAFGILRSLPRGVGTGFRLNYGRSKCAVDGLAAGQRDAEFHRRVRVQSSAATARHDVGAGCGWIRGCGLSPHASCSGPDRVAQPSRRVMDLSDDFTASTPPGLDAVLGQSKAPDAAILDANPSLAVR